jgi:hydroxymethylpyrimidine/phosphomethylpyrimidine kinase
MTSPPVVLSIAATDSGGAAGLAADLATIASLGAHGACVVTAVTAQDTTGVHAIHTIPLAIVEAQVDAVFDDLPVASVKTGMLGNAEAVHLIASRMRRLTDRRPLVVDPVLLATSGAALAGAGVVDAYRDALLPVATVVTPNWAEAVALLGTDRIDSGGDPGELALALTDLCPTVVLTGGPDGFETGAARVSRQAPERLPQPPLPQPTTCTDWLAHAGEVVALTHPAVRTSNDHGTGCTFSAALAVGFARNQREPMTTAELRTAVRRAAHFTSSRLALSRTWDLGRGRGPIAHLTTAHLISTASITESRRTP